MINMYVAVQRTGEKNELKHWKYLRREKKNGKWRYYYEKDNSMLNIGKTEKYNPTYDIGGTKATAYLIKSRETNDKFESVGKDIYDRTRAGYKLYVGRQPLSKISKEQVSIGMQFIKDLLSGNLYMD